MTALSSDALVGSAGDWDQVDSDDADIVIRDGIEVHDCTAEIDNIHLEIVPGKGMTYNGCDTLMACLLRVVPDFRGCSPLVLAKAEQFVKTRFGFG